MMGREVRMVPPTWVHPKAHNSYRGKDEYVPLHDGRGGRYAQESADWWEGYSKWQDGLCEQYGSDEKWGPIEDKYKHMRYTDYAGALPSPDDFMPDWSAEQRTHYMMYEDTSEGTPISPAFATAEDCARWCADNGVSAFAGDTGTYEGWLAIALGGFAPSFVSSGGVFQNGVDFAASISLPPTPIDRGDA